MEWLDGGDADLPVFLKCGISSVSDMQRMSQSELLHLLQSAKQSEETVQRLSRLVFEAKAQGYFHGKDTR